ncbi:hypothetical protein M0R88_00535 [Halorussus gelatinilyticus]|uniref:Uncharacterized protein n=1 Tax=Halorussus gelatinilyticus TaxID=2937524 RepID=A0A8U0IIT4_9EURY|nr:hypothetical protein [Halorussus gelatinilyticus]UPW00605.1 hypothetical protein M0R88_00535 [Halorussus gelatinilyticus]
MEAGDQRRPLEFRVPVSERFWREYGVHLGLLLLSLSAMAVVIAREPGDGVVVGLVFVALSLGAVLAGLVMYNVVVALLIAAKY